MPRAERYSRQVLFAGIGEAGQERLGRGSALLVGCGALGTHIADLLVRAGVGRLRIVDRDVVETSNLHRQSLFDARDVAEGLPKAVAAARRLEAVNPDVAIEPIASHLDAGNIARHASGIEVLLDGTDNFDTRFLLNDYALAHGVPWISGACVGAYGLSMTIVPKETPCLRCLMRSMPPPGTTETCDTAGIIAPAAAIVAAIEAAEALKILSGARDRLSRDLVAFDLWANSTQRLRLTRQAISSGCPACDEGRFEFLERERGTSATSLCGRNTVQVRPGAAARADLDALEARFGALGRVTRNAYLVRVEVEGLVLAVFADGRALVSGTADVDRARSLYDRYVGA
ncbi:MAG TPA: ThiF family adenylyltransferase [Candidatus Polarisedimenticolia bacterium]|nr:ThiF family adenylyltransferase [Candidatus Polarisedimenticolia bacterium]